ncbi:MAG: hypothetical protein V4685_09505 [Bacteroidota bacterium]
MNYHKISLAVLSVFFAEGSMAQNYQAIHGSVYAGSLSAGNNPASLIHVPYSWDITPLAFQFKQSSNAFIVKNFSLLSPSGNSIVENTYGVKNRFFFANQDLRLLNARFKLNSRSAIAFGANLRSYMYGTSDKSNYQDTTISLADFQRINVEYQPLGFDAAASTWAETYVSYARTFFDDGYKIVNAGITLKYNRSIAGGYAKGNDIRYIADADTNNPTGFLLTNGRLQYGYSSNIDDARNGGSFNTGALLENTYSNISADIGIEYIFLSSDEEDEDDSYAYKTKLGISLMDIGGNRYRHSSRSRFGNAVKIGINDTILENKFRDVRDIDDFNDSLATISNSLSAITGDFVVYKPTRLVINIDHRIRQNFFVNTEITLPVISLAGKNSLYIKDMNLLAVTPRWETRKFGAYLPVLFNMRKQLWVGGAFRAGPLLLGIHNLANIFSKNRMQNGGMYVALTIRPGKTNNRQDDENGAQKKKQAKKVKCVSF